ncbi:phytase [Tsuneonella sp. HG094]
MRRLATIAGCSLLAGCATVPPPSLPAVPITASGETVPVGTAAQDAADDPAIWRNAADPAASLIVATDKKAGLYVYGLDGRVRHFEPGGLLNNVDLVSLSDGTVLVVASDRNDLAQARLRLYRLDTGTGRLAPLGAVTGGAGEAYGVCLWQDGSTLYAFSVLKPGDIHQVLIDLDAGAPRGTVVRSLKLATQTEGCVVDPRTGTLFVGEEDVGIWRFDARTGASTTGTLAAPTDGQQLVADVEGLALAPQGATGGWLIASSQGDNAYALYRLPGLEPAGRFCVSAGIVGATEETDGIEAALGDFGPAYPDGLVVVQDGVNAPAAQNFKLVSWRKVRETLGLRDTQ